ncbi:hypothetical protein ACE5IS_10765 [Leptospira wolffii]|uniref:Uncharacterized protein n=1 Tax=Leptospira wolffii TaxID=409998 RepID=A0ABV5BU94_9LEPT
MQNRFLIFRKQVPTFLISIIILHCAEPLIVTRNFDSLAYHYACTDILTNKDLMLFCERSFPSENLRILQVYESWLNEQSPYVVELEQVCKSDSANYEKTKDLIAKDFAKIREILLNDRNEILKLCKALKETMSESHRNDSKETLRILLR